MELTTNQTAEQIQRARIDSARTTANVKALAWAADPENLQLIVEAREALQDLEYELLVTPPLPAGTADVIAGFFIKRPKALEITGSKYIGAGYWEAQTIVTYGGPGPTKSEARDFLICRAPDGSVKVNP